MRIKRFYWRCSRNNAWYWSWNISYVTSSSTVSAGACTGLGVNPKDIGIVTGITKAYCKQELEMVLSHQKILVTMVKQWLKLEKSLEQTTGRKRRCGWFDAVAVKHAGKIKWLWPISAYETWCFRWFCKIKICVAYELNGEKIDLFLQV